MARGRQKSAWANKIGPYPMIFLLLVLQSNALMRLEAAPGPSETLSNSSLEVTCAPGEIIHSGKQFCCNMCNPGYSKAEECQGPGRTTKCKKCEEGKTYQEGANYVTNCKKCYRCKANEELVSSCTTVKNTVCKCKEGFYKHRLQSIVAIDHECRRKKKCGAGERKKESCKEDQDTECVCKDDHYRVNSTTCKRCDRCRENCTHLCTTEPTTTPVTKIPVSPPLAVVVSVTAMATAVPVIVVLVIYRVIKQKLKLEKKSQVDPDSDESACSSVLSSEDFITNTFEPSTENNESVPLPTQDCSERQTEIPVPQVKVSNFIYSVLEVVPVHRVTELVRLLGVKDQDIERARRDTPTSCYEAQYHMLKLWSDRGTRGKSTTLPWAFLQELLDTLRDMGLGGCAESLVDDYGPKQA